jgi:zinc transport system ATP-binding protein
MSDTVAELRDVSFRYPDQEPVLEDVNLTIGRDDFLGLIGPNGSGKTTLLRILMGVLRPTSGTVRVFGRRPREVTRRIGYVPQRAEIDAQVPVSVLDVVLTGRLGESSWGIRYGPSHVAAAESAMEQVGVADLAKRQIGELSGGQRQRVLIARALATDVELLLLDEPMAGVDVHMEQGILATLRELRKRMPIVLVSHDIGSVSHEVNRVACVNRRVAVHRPDELSGDVIGELYHSHGVVLPIHHHDHCPIDEHPGVGPPAGEEEE